MLGILRDRHMEITEDLPQADIIIVNTCTFIEKAKQESIDTILQAARYKTEGKCKILIVTGCLSQQYKEDLMKEMPEIDALLGTGSWDRIWEAIDTVKKGRKACFMDDVSHLYNQNTSRLRTTPKYSAYVKIGEGCNNGCSFCIIPHVRGKLYSRPVDSVVAEVQQLAADGVKEVNLIAQDTTSYGVDLAGHSLLPELLRQLVKIDGIRWIRLFYLYPHYFTDELMDLIVKEEKICPYVDLPLQHISQSVLQRMNRRDSEADVRSLMKKLCSHGRKLTLRSTFIVGFLAKRKKNSRNSVISSRKQNSTMSASSPIPAKTARRQPSWTARFRKKSRKNGIISSWPSRPRYRKSAIRNWKALSIRCSSKE